MDSKSCVLAFSGGRDSTLAAIDLSSKFSELVLVTFITSHLTGLSRVYDRWAELKKQINNIQLLVVRHPNCMLSARLSDKSCLPCQCGYIATIMTIAKHRNTQFISTGYSGYQECWEEQSKLAVEKLTLFLANKGFDFFLPAKIIKSKEEAINRLATLKLSTHSLEQKCLQQPYHVPILPEALEEQIDEWIKSIEMTYDYLNYQSLEIVDKILNIKGAG